MVSELQALGCREPEWHPEGDVRVHTLYRSTPARIDDLPRLQQIALISAVCHDQRRDTR